MKVGDKVRCIEAYAIPLTKGKIYEVLKEEVGGGICVMGDDYQNHSFISRRFELVTPPDDKQDFQPTKSFLLKHKDEYVARFKGCFSLSPLEKWEDDLSFERTTEDLRDTEDSDFDITHIYRLTPVWQRDTRRELTITEAEKEFGVKIRRSEA